MARLRIVNYAVNGSGLGHLTRLVAINRWVRRYAAYLGVRCEIWFLTSSEGEGMLLGENFASFKLPSKTIVRDAGIDKLAYLALAKQWVWHSLGLLQPDLLVVDTFPRGSFGELLSALDLARRRAFVYRPTKAAFAAAPEFQSMLPLYDLVLVPDDAEAAAVEVPDAVRARTVHSGPVMVRERAELPGRDEVRGRLGLAADALAVLVSAGGGGDGGSEAQLTGTIEALAELPGLHLVVAAGALYRGRRVYRPGVTWLGGECAAEVMAGMDVAVAAAGYNTFFELMLAGVPAVFLPQEKIADEQDVRAARAVAAGAAVQLPQGAGADELRAAVEAFRDPVRRAAAAAAARGVAPRNHARDAAGELLRLVLPPSAVDAAEEAVDDELLRAATESGLGLAPFLEVMALLDPRDRAQLSADDAADTARLGTTLLQAASRLALPSGLLARIVGPLARKLPLASPAERAAAAGALLEASAPFEDWNGVAMLVAALRPEREATASDLAAALGAFLARLRVDGDDLYRGLAQLSARQGSGAELPSNVELLRAAQAERVR